MCKNCAFHDSFVEQVASDVRELLATTKLSSSDRVLQEGETIARQYIELRRKLLRLRSHTEYGEKARAALDGSSYTTISAKVAGLIGWIPSEEGEVTHSQVADDWAQICQEFRDHWLTDDIRQRIPKWEGPVFEASSKRIRSYEGVIVQLLVVAQNATSLHIRNAARELLGRVFQGSPSAPKLVVVNA